MALPRAPRESRVGGGGEGATLKESEERSNKRKGNKQRASAALNRAPVPDTGSANAKDSRERRLGRRP